MSRETRILTDKEISQASTMAGLGMPVEQIAMVLGMSKATFDRRQADQPELREALEKGRALASMQVRQAFFKMATGGKHVAATIFWLKVREGWREVNDSGDGQHQPIGIAYQPKSKREAK